MNPEFALIVGCFGLGLVIAASIWLVFQEPFRALEEHLAIHLLGSIGRPHPKSSLILVHGVGGTSESSWVRAFEESWRAGEPSLDSYWGRLGSRKSISLLSLLVEADLRNRFDRGQRPSVADYLARFPVLEASTDRVVSLVYEEFCLLEKRGERPDLAQFCKPYQPWRDLILPRLGPLTGSSRGGITQPN